MTEGYSGRAWTLSFRVFALVLFLFARQAVALARATPAASAGQRLRVFSTSQPIEHPEGGALRAFYQSLVSTERGGPLDITRIIHYGDSHVAADILTGRLRAKFQMGFGDAGPGFILAGRPWPWYSPGGVKSEASTGWATQGIRASLEADSRFGLAGVSVSASGIGEWIRIEADCRRFEIYLLRQPDGGAVDVMLDGRRYQGPVSLASETLEPGYIDVTATADGPHSLELRTITAGVVKVFGVVTEHHAAGVTYDALGINGARASRLLAWDWQVLADNLEHRAPNLVVIAYGSNEAGDTDLDFAEYTRTYSRLLGRLRAAAPEASLLVISPPDRAVRIRGKWQTISRLPALVAAQRRAALDAGAAFWDLFRAMGGAGSIEKWATQRQPLAQADRVHLTRAGYELVAEMLYAELMRGYLWELLR